MDYKLVPSTRRRDKRGYLVDFLKADELKGEDKLFGQMYYIIFERPGAVRGNHYHKNKKEWFVVAKGRVQIILEHVKTKERKMLTLDGYKDEYIRLEIGPNIAHAFTNLTRTAMMVNYCNKPYHHDNPDSEPYILIETDENLIRKEKKPQSQRRSRGR